MVTPLERRLSVVLPARRRDLRVDGGRADSKESLSFPYYSHEETIKQHGPCIFSRSLTIDYSTDMRNYLFVKDRG